MKKNKWIQGKKGFTLMEVLLSLGIFTVVLVSSLFVLSSAHQLSTQSRERLLALTAARSTVEAIKNTSLANVQNINTAAFIPQGLRNGQIAMSVNSNGTLATITVAVTWMSSKNTTQQRDGRLEITTMRSRF